MNEDMWSGLDEKDRAARAALATLKGINNTFAQYNNGLQRVLKGDPYAGMTVARQLSLARDLARTAEALRSDGEARSAAVDKYGEPVLTLLKDTHEKSRVPYGAMVEKWGASDDLTSALKELLREGLIDFAPHGSGAAYWILPLGALKLTKSPVVEASERPGVEGGADV